MVNPFLSSTTIRSRIRTHKKVLDRLEKVYEKEVRRIEFEIADIQARCSHSQVKHENRQSLYVCKICGYESVQPVKPDVNRAKEVQEKQRKVRIL